MGAKAGVKLAYKSVFAPIFTSDVLNNYRIKMENKKPMDIHQQAVSHRYVLRHVQTLLSDTPPLYMVICHG